MPGTFLAMSFSGSTEARTEGQNSVTESDVQRWPLVTHNPAGHPDVVLNSPDCLMMTPALFSQVSVKGSMQKY